MTAWTMTWAHVGTSVLTAFLASLVEFAEAMTILLAVGTVRGWRSAWIGAAAGVGVLTLLVIVAGPALQAIPLAKLQVVVGAVLLLIGTRWLWKAVLRSAGLIGLRDEDAVFASQTAALRGSTPAKSSQALDLVATAAALKAVILEGLEVVLIVIAAGAVSHTLIAASLGAAAAGLLVVFAGVALRRPLARVPENTLKFAVGVLLSAFGTFWLGEGLGFRWPAEDLSLLGLAAAFWAVAAVGVVLTRRTATSS
jgi:Ca2+/H+ antiporter, TMEM165/GDT1 family